MINYIITFFLFTIFSFGQFNYHLTSYAITPNTKCFFGLHGEAKIINGANIINTCYIRTDEGYIVIDSGPTYHYAQQAYHIMQEEKVLPVKYVINTSSNELNILGNQFYQERGAVLIGPESYRKYFTKNEKISLDKIISQDAFENTHLIPLDITLNKNKTINLGKTTIEIKKLESKKAKNLLVYLPKSKIIFAGNFISDNPSLIKNEHDSKKEWAENFNTIEALSWRYIISSHGVKRDRKALVNTKDYLKLFQKKIKKSKPKVVLSKHKAIIKKEITKRKSHKITKKERIPCIHYTNLNKAKKSAIKEHKYVMIKYEADHCNPCKRLNKLLKTNEHIKKMVNQYIEAVKINRDHDNEIPDYDVFATPTILLINPKDNRILVQLEGTETIEDLEDALKVFVSDSHHVGLALR